MFSHDDKDFCVNNKRVDKEPVKHLQYALLFSSCRDKDAGAKLSFDRQFFDDRWSRHRTVTCLDWSTQVRRKAVNMNKNITFFFFFVTLNFKDTNEYLKTWI